MLLERSPPEPLRLEEAFDMFTVVDEALGRDGPLGIEQHGLGQLADPVGTPQVAR